MSNPALILANTSFMALPPLGPNPIAESIKSRIRMLKEGIWLQSIKPYLNEDGQKEHGNPPNLNQFVGSGQMAPEMLSYLWIAIETRHSIVILGNDRDSRISMLNALSAFIPSNEKVVTLEQEINAVKWDGIWNTIALYGRFYNHIAAKDQIRDSIARAPGLILVDEMCGDECKELFHNANKGISFIGTMQFESGKDDLISKLMEKPLKVAANGISALDLAISIQKHDGSGWSVQDITEYKWLSKAEISDGIKVQEADMVQVCPISPSALDESKVMAAYCRMQGITTIEALGEHGKRTALIEKSMAKGRSIVDEVLKYPGW